MSEMVDLAIKQGEEMYKLGRKHEALEIKAELESEKDKLKMKNFNVITGIEVGIDIIDKRISERKGKKI